MAGELVAFRVIRGHVYRPRVRARRGEVILLDPADPNTVRGVHRGQLERTEDKPTAELERMDVARPAGPPAADEDTPAVETVADLEAAAAELVELPVDQLALAVREADPEVLTKAAEMESMGKGRKTALEAIAAELEARG